MPRLPCTETALLLPCAATHGLPFGAAADQRDRRTTSPLAVTVSSSSALGSPEGPLFEFEAEPGPDGEDFAGGADDADDKEGLQCKAGVPAAKRPRTVWLHPAFQVRARGYVRSCLHPLA
ncbi:MAG: hypothetical protein NVS3B26_23690 [Mycobacteriales bacterium]